MPLPAFCRKSITHTYPEGPQVMDCVGSCSSRLQQPLVLGLMQYGYYIIKCENTYSGEFSIAVKGVAYMGP